MFHLYQKVGSNNAPCSVSLKCQSSIENFSCVSKSLDNEKGAEGVCQCAFPFKWDDINENCKKCSDNYVLTDSGTCGNDFIFLF